MVYAENFEVETRYGNKVFTSLKAIIVWNVIWYGKCIKSIVGFQVDGDNYMSHWQYAYEMCGQSS